jgi:hypothetical protein
LSLNFFRGVQRTKWIALVVKWTFPIKRRELQFHLGIFHGKSPSSSFLASLNIQNDVVHQELSTCILGWLLLLMEECFDFREDFSYMSIFQFDFVI